MIYLWIIAWLIGNYLGGIFKNSMFRGKFWLLYTMY